MSRSLTKSFIYKPLDSLYFFIYTQAIYDPRTTLICEWWLLITSHHPVKFSSNKPRGSKYTTKFICRVNSRNRVIEGMFGFVVGHVTPNHKPPFGQV